MKKKILWEKRRLLVKKGTLLLPHLLTQLTRRTGCSKEAMVDFGKKSRFLDCILGICPEIMIVSCFRDDSGKTYGHDTVILNAAIDILTTLKDKELPLFTRVASPWPECPASFINLVATEVLCGHSPVRYLFPQLQRGDLLNWLQNNTADWHYLPAQEQSMDGQEAKGLTINQRYSALSGYYWIAGPVCVYEYWDELRLFVHVVAPKLLKYFGVEKSRPGEWPQGPLAGPWRSLSILEKQYLNDELQKLTEQSAPRQLFPAMKEFIWQFLCTDHFFDEEEEEKKAVNSWKNEALKFIDF